MRKLALLVLFLATQAAYTLDSVPKAEYRERRVKLGAALHGGSALIFAAHEPPMEYQDYRQDEDFYYLTGSTEPGGALLIIGDGPATTTRLGAISPQAYREILFLPMRDRIHEKYTGAKMDAATPGVTQTLGVSEVMSLASLPSVYGAFLAQNPDRTKTVWTQQDVVSAGATLRFTFAVLGTDEVEPTHDVRSLTTR
ncbi:MAG: aminopeptidase P N-terminal domain-containing protein [Acidobacteriaceae bacterium]